jgi:hypothetical protein
MQIGRLLPACCYLSKVADGAGTSLARTAVLTGEYPAHLPERHVVTKVGRPTSAVTIRTQMSRVHRARRKAGGTSIDFRQR